MSTVLVIHKGRTNIVTASLGMDVSGDTLTSQIRSEPNQEAELIATWNIEFATDGTDGELVLTLTASETDNIEARRGYMDIKRIAGVEILPVFSKPLQVDFLGTVTV